MASLGEFNWQGQQRADAPHLKMLESGVRGDLDALAYTLVGEQPMVVKGFELLSNPVGLEASLIAFKVASSRILHPLASESGSIFAVPSNRPNEVIDPNSNPRVQGSIQPGTTTYIGIDLKRSADASTADVVAFLDPSQNQEYSQKIPLRRTLDYVWIVSQSDFTFNRSVCPVAIVTTNSLNVITSFQDARPLLGRLTPGGSVPSAVSMYGWPGGRTESITNPIAGDKALRSFKDVINAVETRLWELGGGDFWYSPTADRNVHLHTGAATFSSSGESFEVVLGTPNHLHWKGLSFSYDNSPQFTTAIEDQIVSFAGLTDLASGDCIYIDLDRTSGTPAAVQKGQLSTLGIGSKPGSRWVIASRIGDNFYVSGQPWPIGSSFALATTSHAGMMKTNLDMASPNPIAATIVPPGGPASGTVTGRGLSNNIDQGTARSPGFDTNSDIQIGRGTASGDNNIVVYTDSATTGTSIKGSGDVGHPLLSVSHNSMTALSEINSTPLFLNTSRFEGTRSWAIRAIDTLPASPSGGSGLVTQEIKYFYKRRKTFKSNCRLLQTASGAFSYNDTSKTLTRTGIGVFQIDSVTPAINDRVLVNVSGALYNGIYKVTTLGTNNPGGVPLVLTRDYDCGGLLSATVTGLGYDVFDGTSVKVTEGTVYANTSWIVNATHVGGSVLLDGTMAFSWDPIPSTEKNSDQLCVMWFDGSYTIITTGPEYPLV